jgi:hypothetical protein
MFTIQWYRFDDDNVINISISSATNLILKQSRPHRFSSMSEFICVYVFLRQTAPRLQAVCDALVYRGS